MRHGRAVVVALLPSITANRTKALSQAASLQERHQADVGRPGEHQGREVDPTVAKEQGKPSLGERLHGNVGRAVPRWSGDLRHCPFDSISRRPTLRLESNCHGRREHESDKRRP